MEIVFVALFPVLILLVGTSMIMVSQFSNFFQFGKYSRRRGRDRQEIQQFMAQLAVAQSQVAQRSKQMEKLSEKLQVSNDSLENLNAMKSKFLSMAVHDMRTPLASIKGFGEMLTRQDINENQKKYVDYIVRGTDQINRLMSDLTDLAVIEAGKLRLEKAPFKLSSLVTDIAPAIGVIAKKNGVEFVYPETEAIPNVEVIGDRFRLVQALMNFLNNAVKFTPAGGRVELKVGVVAQKLTLAVKDTGPGIHKSELKKVFAKFYQSQFQSKKDAKKGWGLGLAIAQEIVMGHGGEIAVDSAGLGKGSIFWYRIPLKPPRAPRQALKLAALALLLALPGAVRAQDKGIPLEQKAAFEKSMEEKAEGVVLRLIGPSRSKIVVDATLDFTRVEKFKVQGGAGKDAAGGKLFLWQNVGADAAGRSELLPGIPSPEAVPGFGGEQAYERENSFPSAFVKKLVVAVILDKSIPPEQAEQIGRIVGDVLQLDPTRGDFLDVKLVEFAPAWKTIWYQPEAMSLLFKYSLITFMTFITLLVVAACFLKLAEAMDSMAQAQSHQLAMDFGEKGGGEGDGTAGEKKEGEGGPETTAEPANKIYFEVAPEQVETLHAILKNQKPDNIALVVAHLKPETKKRFMATIAPELHGEIVFHLGSIRFIEPDVIQTIKEELERRLESAVGGHRNLLEMIEQSDVKSKRELLRILEDRDPELARVARSRIVLFEDLQYLDMRDWSVVLGEVPLEDWATALYHSDDALIDVVKSQMLPKTWAIIEQMMKTVRPVESIGDEAQERVVEVVMKLVDDGRVINPASHRQAIAEAERAAAAAAEREPPPLEEGAVEVRQ